jgi:uncharacterized protein DUF2802
MMGMSVNLSFDEILSLGGAAVGLLGLVAALCAFKAARAVRVRCLGVEASLAAVRRELELMASISMKTGRKVRRIEHEYSGVADRVEQVEQRGPAQCFDQAIDHARRGADVGTLSNRFGLSQGEAELVARLHGRKKIA